MSPWSTTWPPVASWPANAPPYWSAAPVSNNSYKTRSTYVHPLATLFSMKDAGLRIRVQRGLRDRFQRVCQAQDKPAAQVLREFMRAYVDEHKELLADEPAANAEPNAKAD